MGGGGTLPHMRARGDDGGSSKGHPRRGLSGVGSAVVSMRVRDLVLLVLAALAAGTFLIEMMGVSRWQAAQHAATGGGDGTLAQGGGGGGTVLPPAQKAPPPPPPPAAGAAAAHVYSLPYPPHMYTAVHTVHVFIPLYNAEAFVMEAVESVLRQTHPRLRAWVYDDGSTDTTSALLAMKFKADARVTVLTNAENKGPAETKYLGFLAIAKEAAPNDIVLVLDGDDYLVTDEALAIVHAEYITKKAWVTYGSYVGPFSREVRGLDPDTHRDFRHAAWRYGHPRSFRAFLINHLTDADFKQSDGTWLTKGTDRGFVLRFLELAGPARIVYIRTPIYYYRKHANNTWSLISKESKMAQLNHINALPRSPVVEDDIHVFIAVEDASALRDTVHSLAKTQTVAQRVRLHVWNNNHAAREQVEAVVSEFRGTSVDVIHSRINLGRYARFIHIKKVVTSEPLDYAVMVDSGQSFAPDYLERLWKERHPMTYTSWLGKRFGGGAYAAGAPTYAELTAGGRSDVTEFDYADTGGAIIDASLFLMPATLTIPQQFSSHDALWLSYVAHAARWRVRRTAVRPLPPAGGASGGAATAAFEGGEGEEQFLAYLRAGGFPG